MKYRLMIFMFVLACKSLDSESPSRAPTEALQATNAGQGMQLHRYDLQEISRRFAGQGAFDKIMQSLAEERWDTVIQLAEAHLKDSPGNEDAFLFLAIAYASKGQIERGQFFAELILKGRPRHAMALNLMGVMQRQRALLMEDYRDSIAYFNLAHQISPESLAPVLNLGSINLEVGNFDAAYAEFGEAKKICKQCLAATLGSAAAAQALGRYQEAEQDFKSVLDRQSKHPLANYLLAIQTFYVKGESAKSQEMLETVLESEGADADIRSQARELMARIEARQLNPEKEKQETLEQAH
ncbi:MAG: hypothetical protein NTX25_15745 [Proteobacteria bacterium]|nr:hypothetical protein [Pseudomonadota bacterium]